MERIIPDKGAKGVRMNGPDEFFRGEFFRIEQLDEILILSPVANLSELELSSFEEAVRNLVKRLEASGFRDVLLDFEGTDYYGSTALGFFVRLWKRVRRVGGNMVFCNVSPYEREVLELTRLDNLWQICPTRSDALRILRSESE